MSPSPDISDQSESSHLGILFEAALRDYETQTGIALAKHPLAERLQGCRSVESITTVLQEQTQAFKEFRGKDKIMKLLQNTVSFMCKLSACTKLQEVIGNFGMKFSPLEAIHSGLAVLLFAIRDVRNSYDALIELLGSIEQFLFRLDIYTKITLTVAMTETLVKILVAVLSTLALATREVRQGKPKKFFNKLFGEKDVEAALQRVNRLTREEEKLTAAQTLEVVHGLDKNIRGLPCDIMNQIASDMNEQQRDKLMKDVRIWLSAPDHWKSHDIARESGHHGTAKWFIQDHTFSEWKASDPGSLLWIHGKPGAGKTVLCSSIIHDINAMQKSRSALLAFFYCDFREDQKRDIRGLLSSLLAQLYHQSDTYCDILFRFYSEHDEGLRHPSNDALAECLKNLLKVPGHAPVYLVIDALDECSNTSAISSPRAKILELIAELIESPFPNLRVCVTSRPEPDIRVVLDPLVFRSVSLHDASGQKREIENYIKLVVNTNRKSRRWGEEEKQLVIDTLVKKADGMFQWVYCQLDYICGVIPSRIRRALAELPETLDGIYERTLREINNAQWDELANLIAFDFDAAPTPEFHESWCLEDPVDAVLSICPSVLMAVDAEDSSVIQFSHISVRDFLTSDRLACANDNTLRRYHVSMTPAHTLAAQACLGILLHLDMDVTCCSLKIYPLALYAAKHFFSHARFDGVLQNVEDGMKRLFNPSKTHLAVTLWIFDPEFPPCKYDKRTKRPIPWFKPPLHHAAALGLLSIVKFLVIEHAQDVRLPSPIDGATPLHKASRNGHIRVVRFLLECGADVTAQNKAGWTPLHLASQNEHVQVADMLIKHGADVKAQKKDRSTPLHVASQRGQVEVASLLIEHGADVAAQNENRSTPLHLALRVGQVKMGCMLIDRGAYVTAQDKFGLTPLHLASPRGQVEVIRMLIEHGADVMAKDKEYGYTALHLAVQNGQVEVVRMLIEHGADVMAKDKKYGSTPLYLASQNGEVDFVRMLIERGADVMAKDILGWTPLHLVSQNGQVEIVRMLIEHGADVMAKDKEYGYTPLHLASQNGRVEVVRILIEHGADVMDKDKKYGCTSLHPASQNGEVEVVRVLIEHGHADVMARGEKGQAPLHLASHTGQVEVVRILIEHGADVMAKNMLGWTPLHLASHKGQAEVVRMLIEHGANVMAREEEGRTPLHLASENGQVEVVRILTAHGGGM